MFLDFGDLVQADPDLVVYPSQLDHLGAIFVVRVDRPKEHRAHCLLHDALEHRVVGHLLVVTGRFMHVGSLGREGPASAGKFIVTSLGSALPETLPRSTPTAAH
jgi:hypothetical protein